MSSPGKSPFAIFLACLLDESGIFTRAAWATFLNVTEGQLQRWVNDEDIPSPATLRMIIGILEESDGIPIRVRDLIVESRQKRLIDLSTLFVDSSFQWKLHLLASYVVSPLLEGFLRSLSSCTAEQQEIVLRRAGEHCHSLRLGKVSPNDLTS